MRILYTSDTHVHPAHFSRLLHAAEEILPDAVIVGGDINPNWTRAIGTSIEPHKSWIRDRLLPKVSAFAEKHPKIPVLLDLGNDDIAAARALLRERDGEILHLLHRRIVKVTEELAVAGYMTVNPTPFAIKDGEKPDCIDRPGLTDPGVVRSGSVTVSGVEEPVFLDASSGTMEDELQELSIAMGNADLEGYPFIFVSHAPPRDTALDFTGSGLHVGSLAVRRFLEKWSADGRVLASFHGHIHESPWETGKVWEKIGDIPCFNVGQKSHHLRALLLDTLNPSESARLVVVEPSGKITICEKGVWF